jgi:ribosomal protein S27AE
MMKSEPLLVAQYSLARNGVIIGHHDGAEVVSMLLAGKLLRTDHCLQEGMQQWVVLADLADELYGAAARDSMSAGTVFPPEKPGIGPVELVDRRPAPKACPDCGSARIRAAAMIFGSGTRRSSYSGVSARGYSYGRSGGSSTLLAEKCAPPARPESSQHYGLTEFLAGLTAFSAGVSLLCGLSMSLRELARGGSLMLLGISLAIAAYYLIKACRGKWAEEEMLHKANLLDYERKMDAYRRTWVCSRCGSAFLSN